MRTSSNKCFKTSAAHDERVTKQVVRVNSCHHESMTPPIPPREGPRRLPPYQQHPHPGHDGRPGPQPFSPHQNKNRSQLNALGLIALISAVIGFIFAFIPGALIIGWILLPTSFILGLVSLFFQNKSKWMGITALVLSIAGTIIGTIVFLVLVANIFDDSLGSGTTKVAEPTESSAAAPDISTDNGGKEGASSTDAGTRAHPYPIGSVIENDQWRVVVNSVTLDATNSVLSENMFNDPPDGGFQYILVNYSATYLGNNPDGESPMFVRVEYVTSDGKTVNTFDNIVVTPDGADSNTLYTDGTATGNVAFEVPSDTADQGVLAIRPGILSDKVFVAVE